jgi:TonB family protein
MERHVRRTRGLQSFLGAGALSLVGHVALVAIVVQSARRAPPYGEGPALGGIAGVAPADTPPEVTLDPTWVDVVAREDVEPFAPPVPPDEALVRGDAEQLLPQSTAPQLGVTADPSRAAPDRGDGAGRSLPPAFRRDQSTLRTRIGDGATEYRQSRERTASRASSPQPIRQEPVVGAGDSSRTRRPRAGERAAELPTDEAESEQVTTLAQDAPRAGTGEDSTTGDGPLDAEKGRRRFDIETEGVARDTQSARAASNEAHPGRMELSAPASPGAGEDGRGPGAAPGAVARPTAGTAAAVYGGPAQAARGSELAVSTAERQYVRYQAEIRRRVASALRFPKRLALLLEQGETVVHFIVKPDGSLAGAVRIVKSAGFDEFDAEAVSAVTRAAPFPPMSRALSVSMPIAFDNPLVR